MTVEVRVASTLQRLVGGQRTVLGEGNMVAELLEDLDRKYPGFRAQVLDDGGDLHRFVNIFLNDEDVRFLDNLNTALKQGDTMSILPALAGGM